MRPRSSLARVTVRAADATKFQCRLPWLDEYHDRWIVLRRRRLYRRLVIEPR
jgi:hypothetical protein